MSIDEAPAQLQEQLSPGISFLVFSFLSERVSLDSTLSWGIEHTEAKLTPYGLRRHHLHMLHEDAA